MLWDAFSIRIYSKTVSIGLYRNLHDAFNTEPSKTPLSIRDFKEDDIGTLNEGHRHHRLVQEQIPRCIIAVTETGEPCYRQWLIGHEQNDRLRAYFGNLFPTLKHGEALVEGIFTKPDMRGQGIMPLALHLVNEEAKAMGYKRILVYVDNKNIPSLRGCHKAGFIPFEERHETWFLFRRQVNFKPLTEFIKTGFSFVVK